MVTQEAQIKLFYEIKRLLPEESSLPSIISELLFVSNDSAYRRIRGETPLTLDEAGILCSHFHISLDRLLHIENNSVLFHKAPVQGAATFEEYLFNIYNQMKQIHAAEKKEIIYLTKDVPLFHIFDFEPLFRFRYFFWNRSVLMDKHFGINTVEQTTISAELRELGQLILSMYNEIPSSEIWNTEAINSILLQIDYCRDMGVFQTTDEIIAVYDAAIQMLEHIALQAEHGCKFHPGEKPDYKKENFHFFYNQLVLGDNNILVTVNNKKTLYLNHHILEYIYTTDEQFCADMFEKTHQVMNRSTIISKVNEKRRTIFFTFLIRKLEERRNRLL